MVVVMPELKKILYIEDEPDIRTVAQLALENVGGFTLEICESGQQALAVAEKFAPDLILSDVMMPNMDGPEAITELRKISSLSNTPIMFMTAKVQTDEIKELLSFGAIGVIAKPFDPMNLANQVLKLWDKQ
jgi:CheY-like chemotaxis protein